MKEKIFFIYGNKISTTWDKAHDKYFTSKENLSKYVETIEIGDPVKGVNINKLDKHFQGKIGADDKHLNIIIQMHGGVRGDNELVLEVSEKLPLISGSTFIKALVKATQSIPLKIFATSCHGELFQNHLSSLPKGSVMITVADKDKSGTSLTEYNKNSNKLIDIVFGNNGFKLENLLLLQCLGYNIDNNNPMIGLHSKYGNVFSYKAADSALPMSQGTDYSIVKNLFDFNNIPDSHINQLIFQLYNGVTIESLKIPGNNFFTDCLISDIECQNLTAFSQMVNRFYYLHEKPKILKKIITTLEKDKLENVLYSMYIEHREYLNQKLFTEYEFYNPDLAIVRTNLQRKLKGEVLLVNEVGQCLKPDDEFKVLFSKYLEEFIAKYSNISPFIDTLEYKIKSLTDKLSVLVEQNIGHSNDEDVRFLYCDIRHIRAGGLLDLKEPEGISNFSILSTIGAKNAIDQVNDILAYQDETSIVGDQFTSDNI